MTNLGVKPLTKGGQSKQETDEFQRLLEHGNAMRALGPVNKHNAHLHRREGVRYNPKLASIFRSLNLDF